MRKRSKRLHSDKYNSREQFSFPFYVVYVFGIFVLVPDGTVDRVMDFGDFIALPFNETMISKYHLGIK